MKNLICICIVFFLSVAGCSREPQKAEVSSPSGVGKEQQRPDVLSSPSSSEVVAQTTLLASLEPQNTQDSRDASTGDTSNVRVYFNENGRGVAYATKTGDTFRVVHNGKTGGPLQSIDALVLSPDGKRVASSAMANGKWRMFIDCAEGVQSDEVSAPAFSPDSRHIAYAARIGDKWHIIVDNHMDSSARAHISTPFFSADSRKIIYSEKVKNQSAFRLVISDPAHKRLFVKESCGNDIVISRDKTRIAAIAEINKKQRVVRLSFDRPDLHKEGASFDTVSNVVFGSDGASVAYVGVRGEKRYLVVNDREDLLPDGNMPWPPVVRPDHKGAGILISSARGFFLYQAFSQNAATEKTYEEASGLVFSNDGGSYAFTARTGNNWFIVVNGKEGPAFDRVVSPVFSPDCRKLVYRARKDGRRFVVVADKNGKTIRQHSAYEQVFQPVFTSDGKSVAYGVKDGQKLIWKVEKL